MLVPVVDESDSIIEYKERSELAQRDIYRVSALWIENSKKEILLAQRGFNKKNDPGQWGPAVAGTVEKGESYEQNILKEILEEIGICDVEIDSWFKDFIDGKHRYFVKFFKATIDKEISEFIIQKDEVEALKWISKDNLLEEFKKSPNDYLKSLQKFVKERL